MSLRVTVTQWVSARRRTSSFRSSWLTPGLSSHQQLDAGVAARQHGSRKALSKAKRPFFNYFRSEYSRSKMYARPVVRTDGYVNASNVAKVMTDRRAAWGAPWGRPVAGVRTRRKRQDVLERPATPFGEDELDSLIERLIEIRFHWDKADGMVSTSMVPGSLYATTEHCMPYSREFEAKLLEERSHDGETIVINGERITLRNTSARGRIKREYARPRWGFTGVETVPAIVADAVRGPFVSFADEPMLCPRWQSDTRDGASVSEAIKLRQHISRVAAVGLPPRSLLLLLKSVATMEIDDPALDVSLAIAVGENYYGYEPTECLELLRCLRRVAFVRGLSTTATAPPVETDCDSSSSFHPLYCDAQLADNLFSRFVGSAASFLVEKVWSRLPEHTHRLAQQHFFLDWIDFVSLAVEMAGPHRLPDGLPNAASSAAYVSKYFFLRYTLRMDEELMQPLAQRLSRPIGALASHLSDARGAPRGVNFVAEDTEEFDKPLIVWLCASFLVRLVAEALGDVLRHVEHSLRQHAQLAAEEAQRQLDCAKRQRELLQRRASIIAGEQEDIDEYLRRRALARPHIVGAYQLIGRRRPKRMRLRLIPYEAFPEVAHCIPAPIAALAREVERRQGRRRKDCQERVAIEEGTARRAEENARRLLESPFAAILDDSALAQKHIERACGALEWATMVLRHCEGMVRSLQTPMGDDKATVMPTVTTFSAENGGGAPIVEDGSCISQRRAMCEAFVKSRVQLNMDSLFSYIPWGQLEDQLHTCLPEGCDERNNYPLPQEQQEHPTMLSNVTGPATDLTASVPKATDDTPEVDIGCAFLELMNSTGSAEQLATDEVGTDGSASAAHLAGGATAPYDTVDPPSSELTEAENRARAMMERLQGYVDDFQIVVADLLDQHESFFCSS